MCVGGGGVCVGGGGGGGAGVSVRPLLFNMLCCPGREGFQSGCLTINYFS